MAQAKKKTSTKTAKKTVGQGARKQACTRTAAQKGLSKEDRMHIYLITAMSMLVGILLCADVAMMIV
ncbi:hypothetical protein J6X04_02315 [Candidatus Saccharibacteria bacterium]|nr:hypothetical protein [Candidatus Saccharibacteria bacterium]